MIPGLFDHSLVHGQFAVPVYWLQERLDLFLSHLILHAEILEGLQSQKEERRRNEYSKLTTHFKCKEFSQL